MADVTVRCLRGAAIGDVLDAVADLRIRVFRDWPYLYDGDRDYERRYLAAFASSPRALLVGAFANARLVGAATALPLADEHEEIREPFEARGDDVASIFYLAESVLLPEFRGRGLGHRFFDQRERVAREGGFTTAVFCAVVRAANDPRRPRDERPLEPFWHKRGYAPLESVTCRFAWRDVGDKDETEKTLQFWGRRL